MKIIWKNSKKTWCKTLKNKKLHESFNESISTKHLLLFTAFSLLGIIYRNMLEEKLTGTFFIFSSRVNKEETISKLSCLSVLSSILFKWKSSTKKKSSKTVNIKWKDEGEWNFKRHFKPIKSELLPETSLMSCLWEFLSFNQI